jgi:hypothetical protein
MPWYQTWFSQVSVVPFGCAPAEQTANAASISEFSSSKIRVLGHLVRLCS